MPVLQALNNITVGSEVPMDETYHNPFLHGRFPPE